MYTYCYYSLCDPNETCIYITTIFAIINMHFLIFGGELYEFFVPEVIQVK